MKPTDERLKKMIGYLQGFDDSDVAEVGVEDVKGALIELHTSRQTIKRLVEAGRTMRNCIAGQIMAIDETGAIDGFMGMSITQEGYDVLKRIVKDYTALMQELKEEK